MQKEEQVVIIGSRDTGRSVAYHLTRPGDQVEKLFCRRWLQLDWYP